jgi:Transglutaminase-like superfamily
MESWRRFWRLKPADRRIVLEAAAALSATSAGLRIMGFSRWNSMIEHFTSGKTADTHRRNSSSLMDRSGLDGARGIATKLDLAARHLFFRTNCLERSLALRWLLRRRGITAVLRIGARKESERFEAHAWIELNGVVLNDPDEAHLHFAPFKGQVSALETQTR